MSNKPEVESDVERSDDVSFTLDAWSLERVSGGITNGPHKIRKPYHKVHERKVHMHKVTPPRTRVPHLS